MDIATAANRVMYYLVQKTEHNIIEQDRGGRSNCLQVEMFTVAVS